MTGQHDLKATCISCTHFRNSPAYLESVFRGLNTLSSGHASVRKDDGVCLLHDLYLSADAHCEQYLSAAASAVGLVGSAGPA